MFLGPGLEVSQLQVSVTWKLVIRKLDWDQRVNFHRVTWIPQLVVCWQELSGSPGRSGIKTTKVSGQDSFPQGKRSKNMQTEVTMTQLFKGLLSIHFGCIDRS